MENMKITWQGKFIDGQKQYKDSETQHISEIENLIDWLLKIFQKMKKFPLFMVISDLIIWFLIKMGWKLKQY